MKTRSFVLGLFAFAALCACNKEAQPGESQVLENDAYVSVSIVASGDVASRAGTTGTDGTYYDPGSSEEKTVTSALFLFYKNDGAFDQSATPTLKYNDVDSDNPYREVVTEATIVLKAQTVAPASLLVVLNPPAGLASIASTLTLDQMKAQVADYAATAPASFIMTNSNFDKVDNKCEVSCAGKIYDSASEALANPVTVYVERVVAKVSVTDDSWKFKNSAGTEVATVQLVLDSDADVNGNGMLDDENTLNVKPSIKGYKVTNIANESYLFKNVTGLSSSDTWMWDDINKRSYWAVSSAMDHATDFTRFSFDEIETSGSMTFYCNENTDATTNSQLIVAVEFVNGADAPIGSFYKYQGDFYTEDGIKAIALKMLSGCKHGGINYVGSDLVIVAGAEPWLAKIDLTDAAKAYTDVTGGTPLDILATMTEVWAWTNGHAYYFTTVDHFNGKIGMVRNHSYQITVQSIKGFGTPVFDDTLEIDPKIPSDEEYQNLAAEINILQWKIVTQNVNFGE